MKRKNNSILLVIAILLYFGIAKAQKPSNTFLDETPASYVAPQNVKLHRYELEEVPENWKTSGKLETTEAIRRAGYKGISWEWQSGDNLEIDASQHLKNLLHPKYMQVSFGGGIGFGIWIYNEIAMPEAHLNISLAGNEYRKEIKFGLNYSGWRACVIQFAEMPDGGDASEGKILIQPPSNKNNGRFVFDRFEIGRLGQHTMADYQLHYSKNDNHWVNQYWWEQAGKPSLSGKPTSEDIQHWKRIERNIREKSLGWSLHIDDWISLGDRALVTSDSDNEKASKVAQNIRKSARSEYDALNLAERPNIITPHNVNSSPYSNDIIWRHIEEKVFPLVALDYDFYRDEESKERVLSMLNWFSEQGTVPGHSYGSLSHIGYRSRNLAVGLFLCRDFLTDEGLLDQWTETLKWLSGFAECYIKKHYNGGVGDDGTVAMARLICVLIQDNTPEKLRDSKAFFQWFDDVLGISNGTQGVIKPDYSFYHHAMMLAGYWLTNVPQFGKVLMALEGTPYADSQAWHHIKQNLLVFNRMYRSYNQPFNIKGRHFDERPDYRIHRMTEAIALHGNPQTGETIDTELASAWLANRLDTMAIPKEFEGIKPNLRYHQSLNWAGVSTHSIPSAFATITGVNNNTMNWDAGDARAYSRYNRTGTMYLHRGNLSVEENGYVDKGWDWSRLPGSTTPYINFENLQEETKNTGGYGDERAFAGGTNLNDNGIYAYVISDRKNKAWNGKKSWFFFDDRIVCLGSDLRSGKGETLETTLFQLHLKDSLEAITINDKSITAFPFSEAMDENLRLVDAQGHGYNIPKHNDKVEIRKQSQTTGDSHDKIHTGNFAVAWLNHGTAPKNASYEYMIRLNNPVKESNYEVLQKDSVAHVVRDKISGMVGYAIFKASEDLPGPISACSRPSLILFQKRGDTVNLSFCDPDLMTNPGGEITRYNIPDTLESPKRQISLTIDDKLASDNKRLHLHSDNKKTTVAFSTHNAVVETFHFKKK